MQPNENWQWIFALSIDDKVTWALTEANCLHRVKTSQAYRELPPHSGSLVTLKDDDCPQTIIHKALVKLKNSDGQLRQAFNQTVAVGISTLGVVERDKPWAPRVSEPGLLSIARKAWLKPASESRYILNFRKLVDMVGGGKDALAVVAENDATAFCLAEFQHRETGDHKAVYYVLLSDGVNAGILIDGNPPRGFPFHPEVGHLRPALYEHDRFFVAEDHSGCPVHGNCFEGLASHTRIMRQWKKPLRDLRGDTRLGSPLDIIAFYAAELAWAGACAISWDKCYIGGHVMVDELMPLIREKFERLNGGYLTKYHGNIAGKDSLIQPAMTRQNQGLAGGLELARRAIAPPLVRLGGQIRAGI